jgi:hypothetical protein
MKILIKFPTRNRKNKFFNTLKKYHNLCEDINNVKFLISIDEDDSEMNNPDTLEILNTFKNTEVSIGNSLSKIHAVNRDVVSDGSWDIVLLASDDMIPQVKGYDNIIIDKMISTYPDTDGVLWFNDGFQETRLNTLCILGKKYYKRFNYIYNPEYKSTWCDNEFTEVGNILKKQKFIDQIIIKHEHPDWGFGSRDEIHRLNLENENYDKSVYFKNKVMNFGL